MTTIERNDWAIRAASEIATRFLTKLITTDFTIADIIEKHCPFKMDVAYMPVPRCDGCKHWDRNDITSEDTAECVRKEMSAKVDVTPIDTGETIHVNFQMRMKADFGCVQWEAK